MEQSLAWWCCERVGMTPEGIVAAAAEIGYAGVELAPSAQWPLITAAGLRIVTERGHASLEDGLNRRENHGRIAREIRANLDLAVKWGIPVLICFSGNRNGLADAEGAKITAEGLARVAPDAEQAGVTLALELLNSKVDHPDYQCDRTAWGLEVIRAVGSPRVRLLYDIYHMQVMEGDVIRTIRDHHAAFGHYHTAGNPGRHDLDDDQELHYPAIVRAIAATGYDGYLGQEFIPKGEPVAAFRHAFAVCGLNGGDAS